MTHRRYGSESMQEPCILMLNEPQLTFCNCHVSSETNELKVLSSDLIADSWPVVTNLLTILIRLACHVWVSNRLGLRVSG